MMFGLAGCNVRIFNRLEIKSCILKLNPSRTNLLIGGSSKKWQLGDLPLSNKIQKRLYKSVNNKIGQNSFNLLNNRFYSTKKSAKRTYYDLVDLDEEATPEDIYFRVLCLNSSTPNLSKILEAASVLLVPMDRLNYDRGKSVKVGKIPKLENFHVLALQELGLATTYLCKLSERLAKYYFYKISKVLHTSEKSLDLTSGMDLYQEITISFDESILGTKKTLNYLRKVPCDACDATGSREKVPGKKCKYCRSGYAISSISELYHTKCPVCFGTGKILSTPNCSECMGMGNISRKVTKEIDIEPGVGNESFITITGDGNAGERGGNPGNLVIKVRVLSHPLFWRLGNDIHVTVPINIAQAMIGGKITIDTIQGRQIELPVSSQTRDGDIQRVVGYGASSYASLGPFVIPRRGILVVHYKILMPQTLTNEIVELIQLAKT